MPRTRLAPFLLVVVLLAATAAAFGVTEGLKLEPSPISATGVDKVFSPVCRCPTRIARIVFRLRKADTLTLVVVDAGGRVVRTLVDTQRFNRGLHHFSWDGRDDAGAVARDGSYRPRVHLAGAHRTILLPNPIRLDTRPPTAKLTIRRRLVSPGTVKLKAFFRATEPAHAFLYANGQKIVGPTRFARVTDKLDWYGTGFPAGTYAMTLRAVDEAGNLGPATPPVTVRLVYLELAKHLLRPRAGGVLAVAFGPPATVRWRLNGVTGVAHHGRLRIAAPTQPGRYTLYVVADGHADRAAVIVP